MIENRNKSLKIKLKFNKNRYKVQKVDEKSWKKCSKTCENSGAIWKKSSKNRKLIENVIKKGKTVQKVDEESRRYVEKMDENWPKFWKKWLKIWKN